MPVMVAGMLVGGVLLNAPLTTLAGSDVMGAHLSMLLGMALAAAGTTALPSTAAFCARALQSRDVPGPRASLATDRQCWERDGHHHRAT
jgi:hypothetical protein